MVFLECLQEGKIARARDMFYHAEAHFLLYSERFHFFRRPSIKGVLHLVFYQLPTFPHFYSEMCNLMQVRDTGMSLWAFIGWFCQRSNWSFIILRICCCMRLYRKLSFLYLPCFPSCFQINGGKSATLYSVSTINLIIYISYNMCVICTCETFSYTTSLL